MLAASMQCWWMAQALRSHSWCWLVVSSDEMSPYTSRSGTSSVTEWPSVDHWLVNRAVRPERSLRLLSNVYFCGVVDNDKRLDLSNYRVRRQSLLHNITGSVASCYKSHRLPTSLRPLYYVVLLKRRDLETGGKGRSMSLKMAPFDLYDFLLIGSCKDGCMLYHFQVIWRWIIVTLKRSRKVIQTGTIRKLGCGFLYSLPIVIMAVSLTVHDIFNVKL